MNNELRTKKGISLTETALVVAVMSLLVVLGLPAVKVMFNSMVQSPSGTKAMIGAALSSARAIAAKERRYAGVRFQQEGPTSSGDQYMIFIIHDTDATGLAHGFRAVEGTPPVKLPDGVEVRENAPGGDTTFSIIFSPSGKLIIREVIVVNRDGKGSVASGDDIFNTLTRVSNGFASFVQDYDSLPGLQQELSQRSFAVIYGKDGSEDVIWINPYTGMIVNK